MLPRFILDRFKTAAEAINYLREHASIYVPQGVRNMGYEIHFMIGDRNNTYILEFVDNEIKITEKPIMTNFHLFGVEFNKDGSVYTPESMDENHDAMKTNKISSYGSGLERFNLINYNYNNLIDKNSCRAFLNKLKYTNAYRPETNPYWFTEFVGGDLTVANIAADFSEAVAKAQDNFNHRTRDFDPAHPDYYGTWHTEHSSLYDLENKKLYLISQEDGVEYEFGFDYYTRDEVNELLSNLPLDFIIRGYYFNNKFYKDSTYTQEINPSLNTVYVNLNAAEDDKHYFYF